MNKIAAAAVAGALALASCSTQPEWTIKGNISGLSDGDAVVLEGSNQGSWYVIDTIAVKSGGKFAYSHAAQGYPDIYRLRLGQEAVYFPIDSIETVTLTADAAAGFAASHTLSGTPQAENLARVDSLLAAELSAKGAAAVTGDKELKRRLGEMLLADPAGIVTYYIVCKNIDGKPLFDAADPFDNRLIGAVANSFSRLRPTDPRTSYLKRLYLANRKTGVTTSVEANEVSAFEIELYDQTGTKRSLADMLDKGRVVILNFTAYAAEESPQYNALLNSVYEKYHASGLDIYQVSVDDDEYAWKQAARNLPWTTVLNPISDTKALTDYNVVTLPTTYLFDRQGQLVERVGDPSQLEAAVKRLL